MHAAGQRDEHEEGVHQPKLPQVLYNYIVYPYPGIVYPYIVDEVEMRLE